MKILKQKIKKTFLSLQDFLFNSNRKSWQSKSFKIKLPILIIAVFFVCIASVQAEWKDGKFGQTMNPSDYITLGDVYNGVKTISFWVNSPLIFATDEIIQLNATAKISISSTNTISTTGITSPTIYIDGSVNSILPDTNWHFVTITTTTGINASDVIFGKVGIEQFDGQLDEVKFHNYPFSVREIAATYRQQSPSLAQGGTISGSTSSTGSQLFSVIQSGVGQIANFTNTGSGIADAFKIYNLGTGNSFFVGDAIYDGTPFVIDAIGNVGIGELYPKSKLHIYDSGDPAIILDTGGTDWYMAIDDSETDQLVFGTGQTVGSDGILTLTTSGNIGIGTTAPLYKLDVAGDIRTTGTLYATSTEITNLTMTNASTTQLTVSDKSWLGTVSGGVWNGTIIGDDYLTKTGDWTGTFDGQQGSYYLDADNLTDFGNPFYTYFNATTTTALSEGINLYYTDVRVADYINASTTMPVADWNTAYNWGDHAGLYDTLGQATSTKDWLLTQDNTWTGTGDTTFAGNVGIGDTTPTYKLDVNGTGRFTGAVNLNSTLTMGGIINTGGNWISGDGGAEGISINSSGNVGIGTTVPVQKLHVDGKIRVEGVNANQDLIISDGDMIMVQDDKNYLISGGDATNSGANLAMFGGEHAALANLFRIRQGGTTVLSIINGGNVGIGTTAPTAKLQSLSTTEQLRLNYDDANYASFTVASTSSLTIAPSVSTATTTIGSGDETFRIDSSGNVGIGITNPTHQLQLSGTAAKPGTAYWIVASDERLKDVNGDFTRGLEALSGLYPSYFNYKIGNAQNIPHDREYIGLIAQDVQAVIPEAVVEGADGFLAIETDPILWTMLNAIKELALEVGSDIISYQRDDSGQPQVKIAYDDENYVEMQVNATGDLDLSTIGGDVRLPDENMLVCSGGACSSEVSQLNGTGNLAVENTAFIGGSLGVGTVETDRAFSVLRGGDDPQMKIAYDDENYAEMQVSAVGDLVLSARGGDVKLQDENMQVCAGGACPSKAGLLEGAGNLVVENIAYVAGALGVGTAQPQRGLDVYETQTNPQMRISYDEDLYSELSVSATGDLTISAEGGDISALNENFKVCSGDGCPSEVNVLQGTGNLVVENNILALGSVGINTADPSYTLDVNGTLRAHGITDASDIRLKTNIQNLNKVGVRPLSKVGVGPLSQITLSKLDNLRGVTFNWINKDFGENLQVGMIAQELELEYPDLISVDKEGFMSIQYGKFTAVLLEGVKELFHWSQTIEYRSAKLEGRMAELEKENQTLKAKTEKLEDRLHALEQILAH